MFPEVCREQLRDGATTLTPRRHKPKILITVTYYPPAVRSAYRGLSAGTNEAVLKSLQMLSSAADAVCDSDCVSNLIMRKQQWSLLPLNSALNLRIAGYAQGGIGFAGFPEFLGKNSTIRRRRKRLEEMNLHIRPFTSGVGANAVRMDLFGLLKKMIWLPIKQAGKAGVVDALQFMESYGLRYVGFFTYAF